MTRKTDRLLLIKNMIAPFRDISWSRLQPAYLIYRYRYLFAFILIGFASILLELLLVYGVMPASWPWLARAIPAFLVGLVFSFLLNSFVNFKVPKRYLYRTFLWFTLISTLSFTLNMASVYVFKQMLGPAYGQLRLISSGLFFGIAYVLHRRLTFENARDFGLAVYTTASQDLEETYARIGAHCDFLHADIVDETMCPGCEPVCIEKLDQMRSLWRQVPLCLHIMSRTPRKWAEKAWDKADWFLFHADIDDDLIGLIEECRHRGKQVGIVWHQAAAKVSLLPYLPHVDFVMVLAVAEPGRSGQPIVSEALDMVSYFERLRSRYGYHLMVDGGVTTKNTSKIPAKYIVAASAVLRAQNPINVAHALMTGGRFEGE